MIEQQKQFLTSQFLELAGHVETAMTNAFNAVLTNDINLAGTVVKNDNTIDTREVVFEEECLKVLALYQPVAGDLRFIIALLKINNDMERIADLAGNMASRVVALESEERLPIPFNFKGMSETVQNMLRNVLNSFIHYDPVFVTSIFEDEARIDTMHRTMYHNIKEEIMKNPGKINVYINYISYSRYIERMADHIVNIAEDIYYLIGGKIIRHSDISRNSQ
ncbi:MAG TPA: phosphate signaling complex protein PhoU [bacterium]|nr:phosphate signaling complex protein PhoU [bacterium]HPS29617.1 phosphate signaling complex protein PhoU [bacterium]